MVYLIWSEEHSAWWRKNCCGYTQTIRHAGRYSEHRAQEIVNNANGDGRTFCEVALAVPEGFDTMLLPPTHR